jgi:hypothetical protein
MQPAGGNPGGLLSFSGMSQPCIHCGTLFPPDREHFYWHKNDGLSNVCLSCHKAQRRHQRAKEKAKRSAALKKIEASGIDLYAKLAQAGGSNIPHSAELVEKVCEYFGGVAGFAAIMVKQYYDAKPGTSTRNKVLETITRLIQSNVDSGGAKKPLTLWTEEELESELQERFRVAVLSQRILIDAKPSPEGEPAEDSEDSQPVAAPTGQGQGTPERTEGEATGGVEAVPADPSAGGDSQVPSE